MKPKQYKNSAISFVIAFAALFIIILSQIPQIKNLLKMITITEAILTIIVSAGLYTAIEMIYKNRKKSK